MHPDKVDRKKLNRLTDLPNVGPSIAGDLELLGIKKPVDLVGKDPFELYFQLNQVTNARHDPCVIDAFMSITSFMDGKPAKTWWSFTDARKRELKKRGIEL